jgi:hypothetical protein
MYILNDRLHQTKISMHVVMTKSPAMDFSSESFYKIHFLTDLFLIFFF